MAGEGFEPSKAEPGDLQSPPIGRSGNPPGLSFDAACVDYPILRMANNRTSAATSLELKRHQKPIRLELPISSRSELPPERDFQIQNYVAQNFVHSRFVEPTCSDPSSSRTKRFLN